jgi:hypothetical protein
VSTIVRARKTTSGVASVGWPAVRQFEASTNHPPRPSRQPASSSSTPTAEARESGCARTSREGLRFDGIDNDGVVEGLLFPASLAFSRDGKELYVSNLTLYLPYAGAELAVGH